ncbi:hypothetical protein AAG656_28925 [Streptomyces albidoflavus]|uniref:hypothetical protein n=1 Tax=Streptomyces albidoflavus TaxID=1886 RepID=UPI00315AA62A
MPATTSGSLPPPATLTDAQLRGAACVWGGGRLDTSTAVDLGVQPDPQFPGVRWYPRACPACAAGRS